MSHLPPVFSQLENFRNAFNQGLSKLAKYPDLGTFILACANAGMDKKLFEQMHHDLFERYQCLLLEYRELLMHGQDIKAVEEDLFVFFKLHVLGFENIQLAEIRQESIWSVQFNHLRSFRPRRISQASAWAISQPYNENQFNFNKPFLKKECFWKGELLGRQVDLFYNKYPFADLHGLLVIDKEKCLPQFLTKTYHQYMFSLLNQLADQFKGVGFGYNSLGAYASVNHLHFQMFVEPQGLPVCHECWQHNGGDKAYPLACYVFSDADSGWAFIDQLQQNKQAYNLLYANRRVYVVPRQAQGEVEVPSWSSGFTWYEVMGGMLCFNRDDALKLSALDIETHLSALAVNINE